MTYIGSGGVLNSTHSLLRGIATTVIVWSKPTGTEKAAGKHGLHVLAFRY